MHFLLCSADIGPVVLFPHLLGRAGSCLTERLVVWNVVADTLGLFGMGYLCGYELNKFY